MKRFKFTSKRADHLLSKSIGIKIVGQKDTIIAVLVAFVSISMLAALFKSRNTENLYYTASSIPYRLLSAITISGLCVLFAGIYIFCIGKKNALKRYLIILPYTIIAGIIYHVIAINLLLIFNRWMTDEQAYEKMYKVIKVSTQKTNRSVYLLHYLYPLPPAFKEVKVEDPDNPGKFLYIYAYPNFSIDPGYTLKATLRDGILGWKVVKQIRKVSTYETKDYYTQDYSRELIIESN